MDWPNSLAPAAEPVAVQNFEYEPGRGSRQAQLIPECSMRELASPKITAQVRSLGGFEPRAHRVTWPGLPVDLAP